MKTDKVVLGILGGMAAGAMLGILFAPEKGTKTRRKIMDKGTDYVDDLKDKFDTVVGSITKNYEKVWHEGKNLIADEKSNFDIVKNEIKNATN
jgi:gas vesicle protein